MYSKQYNIFKIIIICTICNLLNLELDKNLLSNNIGYQISGNDLKLSNAKTRVCHDSMHGDMPKANLN